MQFAEFQSTKKTLRTYGRRRRGMVQYRLPAEEEPGKGIALFWREIDFAGNVEQVVVVVLAMDITIIHYYEVLAAACYIEFLERLT